MRPRSLDELVGQEHLLATGAPLRAAIERGTPPSLLLWGPPGTGKTTLALLLAERAKLRFERLSAVMDGIKELREVVAAARSRHERTGEGVLLFIDEIHRWNKSQQDALLPHVEEGVVVLVGATTENPSFEVIPALRSRCWLIVLNALEVPDLLGLLERTLLDDERGLGGRCLQADADALTAIAESSSGDARRALSILERAAAGLPDGGRIDIALVSLLLARRDLLHDRSGDTHFDVVSAFIKSLRGSNPDAALYWMARMLEGGEDPLYVGRRMVVFAAEDVGNAEPRALQIAVAAFEAARILGMPEARIPLAQAVTFLATSPKSNASYKAIDAAIGAVRQGGAQPVPAHLRNAPTSLAKQLGHGTTYRNPHDFPDAIVDQDYLPDSLRGARFYKPSTTGGEKLIVERMAWWAGRLRERRET